MLAASSAAGQCAGNGLTLTTMGGRLGDPFSITLSGTPGASGLLGFDLSPGPVLTPVGPVCLGLGAAFQFQPIALDGAGGFGISGIVSPNPAVSGLTVFLQAGVQDPNQPGGFALSNGASATLRSPRVYLVNQGLVSSGNVTPGQWAAYDVLSGTTGPFVQLTSYVIDVISIPALGWIAFTLMDGTIRVFDGTSGVQVLNFPVAASPTYGHRLAVDGTTLIALEWGNPPSPATLRTFALPSGAAGITTPIPSSSNILITAPGSGFVYVPIGPGILPIPLATGAGLQPIPVAGAGDAIWTRNANILYALIYDVSGNAGLNAVDTSVNLPWLANPVPIPYSAACCFDPFFRYGPGSTGPSLFVREGLTSTIREYSAQTFAATSGAIPLPGGLSSFELSNGGTEWLMVQSPCAAGGCTGGGPPLTLHRMSPSTHTISAVGQFQAGQNPTLVPVRSATLTKAFLVSPAFLSSPGALIPLDTDPTTSIQPAATLPFAAVRFLVD
jgi:hypothetical protein